MSDLRVLLGLSRFGGGIALFRTWALLLSASTRSSKVTKEHHVLKFTVLPDERFIGILDAWVDSPWPKT